MQSIYGSQISLFLTIRADICKSWRSSLSTFNTLGTLLNNADSYIHLQNSKGQSKHAINSNTCYKLCQLWLPTAIVMFSQVHSIFHHYYTAFIPLNTHYCQMPVNFLVKYAAVIILMIILQKYVSPINGNYPLLTPKNKVWGPVTVLSLHGFYFSDKICWITCTVLRSFMIQNLHWLLLVPLPMNLTLIVNCWSQ